MKRVNFSTEFYDLAKEAHGSEYDYRLVNTDGLKAKSKITIICKKHGKFEQTVSRHVTDKRGCPECGRIKKSESKFNNAKERFYKEVPYKYHGRYTFDKFVYRGARTPSTITCVKHGDFKCSPNNLDCGKGCPKCGLEARTKHGMSGSTLERVFNSIKQRCYNPKTKGYERYGGRGIKVCDEWLDSNEEFFKWALSNGYKEGLSIERINIDNGYSPENCTWIPLRLQSSNTCRSIKNRFADDELTDIIDCYCNSDITQKDLADRIGVDVTTLRKVILKGHTKKKNNPSTK